MNYASSQKQIRPLNLRAGELVKYVAVKGFNSMSGKKGFVLKKTQQRSPHRTDVYLVKFQHEEPQNKIKLVQILQMGINYSSNLGKSYKSSIDQVERRVD